MRLIYLSGEPPTPTAADTSTRHVAKGSATEVALTDARPERRAAAAEPPEPHLMAKKPSKKKSPPSKADKVEAKAADEPKDEIEAEADVETREVHGGAADAEEVEKPRAKVAKISVAEEPAPTESVEPPAPKPAPESALGNLGWAVGVLLLGVVILALLAQLPPLE